MTDSIQTPADTTQVPPREAVPPQTPATAAKAPETQPLQVPPSAPEVPKNPLADAEFLGRLATEVAQTGDLAPESYTALTAAGFPEAIVKSYVEGQKAQHAALVSKIHGDCGGEAAVNEALQWAAQNLPAATVEDINKQLASPNPDVVITAVKGLQARAGVGGRMVAGQSGGTLGPVAYESEAQMYADMKSPSYKTDPAFRATVKSRLEKAVQQGKISMSGIVDKGSNR